MSRKLAVFAVLATLLIGAGGTWAKKIKTGQVKENVFTDTRYGFTFEKNDAWKFKTPKEKPDEPQLFRFELQKTSFQLPKERQFAPESWTAAYGGFFIDTTSLNLEQFKTLLTTENRKHKQKKKLAKYAEIIRDGIFVAEKRYTLGNLGEGHRLTFKEEYDAQIVDIKGDYNIITDFLMGEVYFTVKAGKVYGFFFTVERAEYRIVKSEIERMLTTLKFPDREKNKPLPTNPKDSTGTTQTVEPSAAAAEDSTSAKDKPD